MTMGLPSSSSSSSYFSSTSSSVVEETSASLLTCQALEQGYILRHKPLLIKGLGPTLTKNMALCADDLQLLYDTTEKHMKETGKEGNTAP